MLKGNEVHWLPSIMVMIVIGIHWVLYGICYEVQSTSVTGSAESYIWGKLSQKLLFCCVASGRGMVLQVQIAGVKNVLGHEGHYGGCKNVRFFHVDCHRKRYQRLLRLFLKSILQNYQTGILPTLVLPNSSWIIQCLSFVTSNPWNWSKLSGSIVPDINWFGKCFWYMHFLALKLEDIRWMSINSTAGGSSICHNKLTIHWTFGGLYWIGLMQSMIAEHFGCFMKIFWVLSFMHNFLCINSW